MEPRSGFGIYMSFQFCAAFVQPAGDLPLVLSKNEGSENPSIASKLTYCGLGAKCCALEFGLDALYTTDDA